MYGMILRQQNYLQRVVDRTWKFISAHEIQALVVTGTSGLVPATSLFDRHGIPFVYIRKSSESHHGSEAENTYVLWKGALYVILDDLIESGATMRHVLNQIQFIKGVDHEVVDPVGIVVYNRYYKSPAYFQGVPVYRLEVDY